MTDRYLLLGLDGILLSRQENRPTPWAQRILELGRAAAICTNQEGVAWNLMSGRSEKYPDWPGTVSRICLGMEIARVPWCWVSLYCPDAKLPDGKLLRQRAESIGLPPSLVPPLEYPVVVITDRGRIYASWDPGWRKPNPGMLIDAMVRLGLNPRNTLYVGSGDDDRLAAMGAGVGFVDAREFAVASGVWGGKRMLG